MEPNIDLDRAAEPDSLIRTLSNFTPKKRVHVELESLLETIEKMNVTNRRRTTDSIAGDRADLRALVQKTKDNNIVKKPADKGDILVVQNGIDYYDMCMAKIYKKKILQTTRICRSNKGCGAEADGICEKISANVDDERI